MITTLDAYAQSRGERLKWENGPISGACYSCDHTMWLNGNTFCDEIGRILCDACAVEETREAGDGV